MNSQETMKLQILSELLKNATKDSLGYVLNETLQHQFEECIAKLEDLIELDKQFFDDENFEFYLSDFSSDLITLLERTKTNTYSEDACLDRLVAQTQLTLQAIHLDLSAEKQHRDGGEKEAARLKAEAQQLRTKRDLPMTSMKLKQQLFSELIENATKDSFGYAFHDALQIQLEKHENDLNNIRDLDNQFFDTDHFEYYLSTFSEGVSNILKQATGDTPQESVLINTLLDRGQLTWTAIQMDLLADKFRYQGDLSMVQLLNVEAQRLRMERDHPTSLSVENFLAQEAVIFEYMKVNERLSHVPELTSPEGIETYSTEEMALYTEGQSLMAQLAWIMKRGALNSVDSEQLQAMKEALNCLDNMFLLFDQNNSESLRTAAQHLKNQSLRDGLMALAERKQQFFVKESETRLQRRYVELMNEFKRELQLSRTNYSSAKKLMYQCADEVAIQIERVTGARDFLTIKRFSRINEALACAMTAVKNPSDVKNLMNLSTLALKVPGRGLPNNKELSSALLMLACVSFIAVGACVSLPVLGWGLLMIGLASLYVANAIYQNRPSGLPLSLKTLQSKAKIQHAQEKRLGKMAIEAESQKGQSKHSTDSFFSSERVVPSDDETIGHEPIKPAR